MIIAIAGPYSADTEERRQANLDVLNKAAAQLLTMGHVPVIGVNAALPVVNAGEFKDRNEVIMRISIAVMQCCEAIWMTGESPGANREKELFIAKGLPVYYSIEDIRNLSL